MKKTKFIYILLCFIMFFGFSSRVYAASSKCSSSNGKWTCTFYKKDDWTFKKITKYKNLCMSTVNSYTGSGKCVFYYEETLVSDSVKCGTTNTTGGTTYYCKTSDPTKSKTAIYDPSSKKTIQDGYVTKESDIKSNSNVDKKSWSKMVITFSDNGQFGLGYDIIKSECSGDVKQPIKDICNKGSKITVEEKNQHVQEAVTPSDDSDGYISSDADYEVNIIGDEQEQETCEEKLGPDLVKRIQEIVDIIEILVPILLIVYGIIDFGKAIFVGDENEMKKSQSRFIKRLIVAVGFFLVPTVLQVILNIANQVWSNIDPSLCGIKF